MNYGTLLKIIIGLQLATLSYGVVIERRLTRLETIYELKSAESSGTEMRNTEAWPAHR